MKRISIAMMAVAAVVWISLAARAEVVGVCKTATGTGWLEVYDDGGRVLHLSGSYYDMGFQHATLLKKETELAVRAARNGIRMAYPGLPATGVIKLVHRLVYQKQAPFMPAPFVEEMRGLADGSGVPLEFIQALHAATFLTSCSGAAAWGPASADGELYFMRSNDVAINIDPVTGTAYQDYGMIIVYQPLGEVPYLINSWPGSVGASDGMNAEGIAIGNMSLPSKYETAAGLPMMFRIKQALAKSHSLDEAVLWMTKEPRAGGYNFLVADAKIPAAVVIEMDARTVYVGGWDGPAESNRYTFKGREYSYAPMEDLLTRTNHPLSSELIADRKQKMDDGKAHSKLSAQRYLDLRARLVSAYGRLDLQTMSDILRAHYNSIEWETGRTLGGTSHQFVFAPRSGEVLVSTSHGNPWVDGRAAISAFNQPAHHYNFYELLERKPPSDE